MAKSKTKFYPLNDVVIVERLPVADTTAGGIVLPDNMSRDKIVKAVVLAVGPGFYNVTLSQGASKDRTPVSVKVGQTVLFRDFGSLPEIEKDVFGVHEHELIAVVE
jgi:chaperonin GroES